LRDKRFLLVLDNCEHVAAGVRALLPDLLSGCDGLAILATRISSAADAVSSRSAGRPPAKSAERSVCPKDAIRVGRRLSYPAVGRDRENRAGFRSRERSRSEGAPLPRRARRCQGSRRQPGSPPRPTDPRRCRC
jgi:hypothetical protein